MDRVNYLIEEFKKVDVTITPEQSEKLTALYEYMAEYNKKVNLTAVTGFEDAAAKHFVDSIQPFVLFEPKKGATFIDIGAGAGFPSLPLMIYREDLKGTLLDASEKRCTYLEQVCGIIGLKPQIVHARAEDYADKTRESFDFATARAVAALPVLSEYCLPYVKQGGYFYALKSVNESAEGAVNAITVLGGKLRDTLDYKISNGDSRRLFITEKISHTSPKYPRNPAAIKKKPL